MQLKSDIWNEAVGSLSVATSSDEPNNLEESSDPLHPIKAPPINMLDILLNGIGGDKTTPNDQVNTATANMLCENEIYQLLLGNDLRWKYRTLKRRYAIVLGLGGNRQPTDLRIWRDLLSSTLPFLQHPPHLSASGAKLQESSLSNEIGCRRRLLLLWCIAEKIGSFCTRTMRRLLGRGCIVMTIILLRNKKPLLPIFENEEDAESKINVGVDEDKELWRGR
jgi:hypothetical protein